MANSQPSASSAGQIGAWDRSRSRRNFSQRPLVDSPLRAQPALDYRFLMAEPFWSNGLHFECQGSSNCCTNHGEYAYVYLALADLQRLANRLDISLQQFIQSCCETTDGRIHLKNRDPDCQFLVQGRCSVYDARPMQCQAWPFCVGNMDAKTWYREVAPLCPGIGKGPLVSAAEIATKIEATRRLIYGPLDTQAPHD